MTQRTTITVTVTVFHLQRLNVHLEDYPSSFISRPEVYTLGVVRRLSGPHLPIVSVSVCTSDGLSIPPPPACMPESQNILNSSSSVYPLGVIIVDNLSRVVSTYGESGLAFRSRLGLLSFAFNHVRAPSQYLHTVF